MKDNAYIKRLIGLQEIYKTISTSNYFVFDYDDICYIGKNEGNIDIDDILFVSDTIEAAQHFSNWHRGRTLLVAEMPQEKKEYFSYLAEQMTKLIEQKRSGKRIKHEVLNGQIPIKEVSYDIRKEKDVMEVIKHLTDDED